MSKPVVIKFTGDTEGLQRALRQVGSALEQTQRETESWGHRMSRIGGGLADFGDQWSKNVTAPIMAGFAVSFAAFDRQEQAEARLRAAIQATGGAAGVTAEHITDYAAQLQRVTTFGDEATISAAAQLLTFRSLRNEVGEGNNVFDRTLAVAQDLSAMFGGDLQGSVLQLGRALEDPIAGLTALRRSGVSFSDAQREQIALLVESGQLFEAQKLILAEVEAQVGGTARVMAETAGGQMRQAFNDLGDAAESVGAVLAPAVSSAATFVGNLAQRFQTLNPTVQTAGVAFLGVLAAVGPILSISGRLMKAVGDIAQGTGNMGRAAHWAGPHLKALAPALGGLAAATAVVVGAKMALDALGLSVQGMVVDFDRLRVATEAQVVEMYSALLAFDGGRGAVELFDKTLADNVGTAERHLEMLEANGLAVGGLRDRLDEKREATAAAEADTARLTTALDDNADSMADTETEADRLAQGLSMLDQTIRQLTDAAFSQDRANRVWIDGLVRLADQGEDTAGSVDIFTEAGRRNQETLERVTSAGADVIATMIEQGATAEEVAEQQELLVEGLRETALQAGFTESDIEKYVDVLRAVPTEVTTTVRADTSQAEAAISRVASRMLSIGQGGATTSVVGMRAAGGPVSAFHSYVVGETGPEILTMGAQSGYVTPNVGSPAGATNNITVNVSGGDPEMVVDAIRRWVRRNGPVGLS
jgi:hypothetical protein